MIKAKEKMRNNVRQNRTPSCGCDSAAVAAAAAAAVRGEAAGILEKSHKVEKIWKKFNLKQYFLVFTNK